MNIAQSFMPGLMINRRPLSLSPSPHLPEADGERDGVRGYLFLPSVKTLGYFHKIQIYRKLFGCLSENIFHEQYILFKK